MGIYLSEIGYEWRCPNCGEINMADIYEDDDNYDECCECGLEVIATDYPADRVENLFRYRNDFD